mgnify:CR=1 FL=1
MPFSATITLSAAGADAVTFDIYSNIDSYAVPFESTIPKASMLAGYVSTNVPTGTTSCRVVANCGNYVDMPLDDPYIYVYTRCDTGNPYYNIGLTSAKAEDNAVPTPHCYQYADEGFLSAMLAAYPSLTENLNLVTSSCECV